MSVLTRRLLAFILTTCICTFMPVSQCLAGAWTMEEGKLYERFGFNYYFADSQFNRENDGSNFKNFRDMNFSNYLEYGLSNRFTIINALYYKMLEKEADSSKLSSNGLGDIDIGVKGKLAEGSWGVVSTQGLVKIPGIYSKNDQLPLGNGQVDVELRGLYGKSLWRYIPGYCNVELAYRWRYGDPSDELRYIVEFGMDFPMDFYGRIKLDGILSMNNGRQFGTSGNPMATNNFDLGKLDMALGYRITKKWGVEACYTPEIYGRNTTEGATYTIAITYQTK